MYYRIDFHVRGAHYVAQAVATNEQEAIEHAERDYPEFRGLPMTGISGPYPNALTQGELGWQQ